MTRFRIALFVLVLGLAPTTFGQLIDFECQGPPCGYTFPVGKGAPGDCDGVSWNGLGFSSVDVNNGCGFPCSNNQYLRMVGAGPVFAGPCQPPIVPVGPIPGGANEIYVRIPLGATSVSFCWDFYNGEALNSPFNDGMIVDVLDTACAHLALLAHADTFKPYGICVDSGAALCPSGFIGTDFTPVSGPEFVSAPLPVGAAFLRIAVWDAPGVGVSHGVVDDLAFVVAPPCPGTESICGDDITGIPYINGVVQAGYSHVVPVGGYMGFDTVSPGGTFDFAPLYVFGELFACAVGPLPGVFPGLCISATGSSIILAGGGTGPYGLPLALPPAPGFNVTYGPNPGITGMCVKVQGVAVSPLACNTFFATTDCHTFSF